MEGEHRYATFMPPPPEPEIKNCFFEDCPGKPSNEGMVFTNSGKKPNWDFPLGERMHIECYIHYLVRKFMKLESEKHKEKS